MLYAQLCDGVGVARLLNATLVLPKFEVAAYWNESRYFIFHLLFQCLILETIGFKKNTWIMTILFPLVSGFADVFDVDYFIEKMNGFVRVTKELPAEIASKEPFPVDCSKRKGHFDYVESVLPLVMEHQFISITPAMSQRRDRY